MRTSKVTSAGPNSTRASGAASIASIMTPMSDMPGPCHSKCGKSEEVQAETPVEAEAQSCPQDPEKDRGRDTQAAEARQQGHLPRVHRAGAECRQLLGSG